ncbi:MAG: monovalent cation/H+ antiporter complex subunit F [Candidatus Bipolaricaulia bacterium]
MAIVEAVLLISLVAVLGRLLRGPTPWDRLLSYNSAANRVLVLLAITAVGTGRSALLDVAVVYVALSFLGVVILARFMERGGANR